MQMDKTTRLLPINLQLFADGDGGAGGANPDTGGTGGTNDPNAGGQGGGQQQTKVSFTPEQQAELDRILGERLSRAEKTAAKKALEARAKELGFDSVEAMEAALKAHKEAQEKEKSELQKAQEAKAAAEAKAKAAEERAKMALIRAAFAEQAIAHNLVSADDAFKLADLSKVTVNDDGTVEGVKEAVEQLVKEKPYLVKQTGGQGGAGGGNPPRGNVATEDPAEYGRQMAAKRNQQQEQTSSGFDPWSDQTVGGVDPNSIAQAVAAAVAAALQGNK